ncbi:hypothetical protein [Brevibacterium marinum]|uniref:Methionine synthase n=1 Tax=Brevibacterium marinum TaxID=418643 RepID=A0A846RXW2_9MICO|nr:hypothetical protein [Brevibacterium marinum]NJC56786.1 hypothetical protein [Brevibacterium marinum]
MGESLTSQTAASPAAAADPAAVTEPARSLEPAGTTTGIWIPGPRPESGAGGTGYIAGSPVREAAAAAFTHLGEHLPPVPLNAHRSEDRWGADAIGRAVSLLTELHVDRASFGWRLTSASGRDERLETSALYEAFDAIAEYGEGYTGRVQISLPGPWTLVTALSLSSGASVLGDFGARRDVIQAYAFGIAEFADRLSSLGMQPVIRLVETRLHPVLTGTWPTVSGWATLPAIPEAQVYAGLQSTLRHLPPTLLSLPDFDRLRLQGKEITAAEVVRDSGVTSVSVPLASLKAHGWEQLAMIAEAGIGTWLGLPPASGSRPKEVKHWLNRIVTPWTRIGMGASSLRDFGVLAGEELPMAHPPLLTSVGAESEAEDGGTAETRAGIAPSGRNFSTGTMMIAAGLRRAFEEIE